MWERLFKQLTNPSAVFVAGQCKAREEIMGFVYATQAIDIDSDLNWGEVQAIYVANSAWGKRVGFTLMQAACKFLKQAEYDRVALWVLDGNLQAMNFYERFGFVKDTSDQGTKLVQLEDIPVRELRYFLEL